MTFNPLFIDTELKQVNAIGSGNANKSYLFQDIINVAKNLTEERSFSHSSILSNLLNDIKGLSNTNEQTKSVLPAELESLLSSLNELGNDDNITSANPKTVLVSQSILLNNSENNIFEVIQSAIDKLNEDFDIQIHLEDGVVIDGSESNQLPDNVISILEQKLVDNEPVLIAVNKGDTTEVFNLSLNKVTPEIISTSNVDKKRQSFFQLTLEPVTVDNQKPKQQDAAEKPINLIATQQPDNNNIVSGAQQLSPSEDIKKNINAANKINNTNPKSSLPSSAATIIRSESENSPANITTNKLNNISYSEELSKEVQAIKSHDKSEISVSNQGKKNELPLSKPSEKSGTTLSNQNEITLSKQDQKSEINLSNQKLMTSEDSSLSEKVISKEIPRVIPTAVEKNINHSKNSFSEGPHVPVKSDNQLKYSDGNKIKQHELTKVKVIEDNTFTESKIIDRILRKSMVETFEKHHSKNDVKNETNIKQIQDTGSPTKVSEFKDTQTNPNRVLIELHPKFNSNNLEEVNSKLHSGFLKEMQNISTTRKVDLEVLHKELTSKSPETIQLNVKPAIEKSLRPNSASANNNTFLNTEDTSTPTPEHYQLKNEGHKSERFQTFINESQQKIISEVKRDVHTNVSENEPSNKQSDLELNSLSDNSKKQTTVSNNNDTSPLKETNSENKATENKASQNVSGEKSQNINSSTEHQQPVFNQKEVKIEQPTVNTQPVKINTKAKEQPELNAKLTDEINDLIISDKKDKAVISLEPAVLGKIKIALEIIENKVTARMEVENQAAKEMLQNQVDFLRENINNNGVQISSVSISLQQQDQKNSKANRERRKENNVEKAEVNEKNNQENNTRSLGYNTYEFLA